MNCVPVIRILLDSSLKLSFMTVLNLTKRNKLVNCLHYDKVSFLVIQKLQPFSMHVREMLCSSSPM